MEQSLTTHVRGRRLPGRVLDRVPGLNLTLAGAAAMVLALGLLLVTTVGTGARAVTAPPSPSTAPERTEATRAEQPVGSAKRRTATRIGPGRYQTVLRPGQERWFRFRVGAGERPRVRATVRGAPRGKVPARARGCQAWRVELFNPYGEGGAYPPYGRSGAFAGVGSSRVAVTTSGAAASFSDGIDYAGTWRIRVALAGATSDSCTEHLSGRAYPVGVVLLVEGADETAQPAGETAVADPEPADDLEEESAATKYRTPVSPNSTPLWVYPTGAVAGTLLAGAAFVGVRLAFRRRRQGW
jgi:hypothetical protein